MVRSRHTSHMLCDTTNHRLTQRWWHQNHNFHYYFLIRSSLPFWKSTREARQSIKLKMVSFIKAKDSRATSSGINDVWRKQCWRDETKMWCKEWDDTERKREISATYFLLRLPDGLTGREDTTYILLSLILIFVSVVALVSRLSNANVAIMELCEMRHTKLLLTPSSSHQSNPTNLCPRANLVFFFVAHEE